MIHTTKFIFLLFFATSCQTTESKTETKKKRASTSAGEVLTEVITSCPSEGVSAPQKFKRKTPRRLKRGFYRGDYEKELLTDVLAEFAEKSGVSIVVGSGLQGDVVSASFKRKSFIEALRIVLFSGPYDYRLYPAGRFIFVGRVSDRDAGSNWQLNQSFAYRTRFIKPSEVVGTALKQYSEYVHGNDTAGVISITAPARVITAVVGILNTVDRPRAQILLNLNILELEKGTSQQLGKKIGSGGGLGALDALSPIAPAFRPAILSGDSYRSFLESVLVLSTQNSASIKAQPKIMAQDGQVATFQSNRKVLLGGNTSRSTRTPFTEVPTGLTVRPILLDGGRIQLDIESATHSEVSTDSREIQENSIKTRTTVRLGDAVVIGGMIHKRKRTQIQKIPLLGDLPWVGWLFRNEAQSERSVETVFTIKPELICHD